MIKCSKCHKEFDNLKGMKFCPYCGCKTQKSKNKRARGNGTGTAFRRGSVWQVQVVVGWDVENGKQKAVTRSKTGFKTKADALAYAETLKHKKQQERTLKYYWDIWSNDEMTTLSKTKQSAYSIAYRKLGTLVYTNIDDISLQDLKRTVSQVAPTYYTARDIKTLLRKLYDMADADGAVSSPRLPQYIKLPKLNEKEGRSFTSEQLTKLWNAYDEGDIFVGHILLMIYTGMMPGELLGLKKSNIDLDNRQIVGAGKKTKVRRSTPISLGQIIVPVVVALINASDTDKIVTCTRDTFYERYHDSIKKAGVRDIPPYSCRHTTATALAVGLDVAPEVIKKVMRWSTSRMLDRYAHPDTSDALDAVNKLKKG